MDIGSYGDHAVALANTWAPNEEPAELLPDVAALDRWIRDELGLSRTATRSDLDLLREVRGRLRTILEAPTDAGAVDGLNELLRRFPVHPVISGHGDQDWHLHLAEDDRPLGELVAAAAAFGLTVRLVEIGFDRRGVCSADDCGDVYLDTSRNHSRRYCSSTCSSRANVAAYRARQRQADGHGADG
jgi:predicted RNA-binding Zn ribbon-like protein